MLSDFSSIRLDKALIWFLRLVKLCLFWGISAWLSHDIFYVDFALSFAFNFSLILAVRW